MKPSATQILCSASPPTCFPLLGSCVFIGFLSWALIPMQSLWISKWTGPCYCSGRDLKSLVATSFSRRDVNLSLCSFELVTPDVATSISCRDINLMNCNFQLMVPNVATSIPCRDISSYLCSFQLMSSVVATSILCRDITSCFCRFHWLLLVSRQQPKPQQFHLFNPVITSRRFSYRDLHSLSRHQPLSRHHDAVATSFL